MIEIPRRLSAIQGKSISHLFNDRLEKVCVGGLPLYGCDWFFLGPRCFCELIDNFKILMQILMARHVRVPNYRIIRACSTLSRSRLAHTSRRSIVESEENRIAQWQIAIVVATSKQWKTTEQSHVYIGFPGKWFVLRAKVIFTRTHRPNASIVLTWRNFV